MFNRVIQRVLLAVSLIMPASFTYADNHESDNPFTTQFKTIDETASTFTKPDSILQWDTHNINDLTFSTQQSTGVNFLDIDSVHSNGFTPSLTELSDSQFIGIDEATPEHTATTSYYDSIHTRNAIEDSIFGPCFLFSNLKK